MEQIKQIKLPNGSTYEVVDEQARQNTETLVSKVDDLDITVDDINTICGSTTKLAKEVKF